MIPAVRSLLDDLARKHGLGEFPAAADAAASFLVNDDVEVFVAAEDDAVVLYARIGDAPEGNPEFLEELLASNLFWRDTDGATLALERYTRAILLARRYAAAELPGADALDAEVDGFAAVVARWRQVIDVLRREQEPAATPVPSFMPSQLA